MTGFPKKMSLFSLKLTINIFTLISNQYIYIDMHITITNAWTVQKVFSTTVSERAGHTSPRAPSSSHNLCYQAEHFQTRVRRCSIDYDLLHWAQTGLQSQVASFRVPHPIVTATVPQRQVGGRMCKRETSMTWHFHCVRVRLCLKQRHHCWQTCQRLNFLFVTQKHDKEASALMLISSITYLRLMSSHQIWFFH